MRGGVSPVGTERKARNGYWYVKVEGRGWVLKHWLVAESQLGRQIDSAAEGLRFKDGNKDNMSPDNIEVFPRGSSELRRRIDTTEKRIAALQKELDWLKKQLPQSNEAVETRD